MKEKNILEGKKYFWRKKNIFEGKSFFRSRYILEDFEAFWGRKAFGSHFVGKWTVTINLKRWIFVLAQLTEQVQCAALVIIHHYMVNNIVFIFFLVSPLLLLFFSFSTLRFLAITFFLFKLELWYWHMDIGKVQQLCKNHKDRPNGVGPRAIYVKNKWNFVFTVLKKV